MADAYETGKQTEVAVGGQTIAYTNATYDLTYDTSSSDMNDSPTPYTSVTSRYAEGSIEWDGSQVEAHEVFINPEGDQVEDITLRISDNEKTIQMQDVTLTNLGREHPADDKSNGTIEFTADSWRRE